MDRTAFILTVLNFAPRRSIDNSGMEDEFLTFSGESPEEFNVTDRLLSNPVLIHDDVINATLAEDLATTFGELVGIVSGSQKINISIILLVALSAGFFNIQKS